MLVEVQHLAPMGIYLMRQAPDEDTQFRPSHLLFAMCRAYSVAFLFRLRTISIL
jgi:hypothetical protein